MPNNLLVADHSDPTYEDLTTITVASWKEYSELSKRLWAEPARWIIHEKCRKCGTFFPFHFALAKTVGAPPFRATLRAPQNITIHLQWRKIPDWQTRDYLASVLGFRPGEEDIKLMAESEVNQLRKGPPLESIFTYAHRGQ